MQTFALAATGRDRPGIVAAVTKVLFDHGVNIEDAEMAILRGHFAIVLVLAARDELDRAALERDLEAVRRAVPLEAMTLSEVEALAGAAPASTHAISVYGADHPGIVYGVTRVLAEHDVNIVDLSTRVVGDPAIYVMLLDVSVPPALDEDALEALLAATADELGVDVSARAVDADVL
jgi:glycine cleavage system transcriptional repressor